MDGPGAASERLLAWGSEVGASSLSLLRPRLESYPAKRRGRDEKPVRLICFAVRFGASRPTGDQVGFRWRFLVVFDVHFSRGRSTLLARRDVMP
jgi:hypothetical protein